MPFNTVPNAKLLADTLDHQDYKLEHAPCVSPSVRTNRGRLSQLVKKLAEVHSLYCGVDGGIDVDEGLTCVDVEVVASVVVGRVAIC